MKLRYLLLCFIYIILAPFVFAQSSIIKINEFLIEPTPQIVELLNTGTEIVDLSNWYIDDNGGTTYFIIPTGTQLYPNACISFSGSLNLNRTSADAVRLFDSTAPPTSSSASLIDIFEYKSSSGSGVTFQRIPDGQSIWSTGSANFDLYNLTGASCKFEPTPTAAPTATPTSTATPAPTSVQTTPTATPTTTPTADIKAIYLSEVYPYPNEEEAEWVELFNDNAFSVFLDSWKIDDVANGGSTPKKFSITIPGYSFKTIDITSSIFNNDGDDVRLLNTNDSVVDSFSYDDTEKGKSVGRTSFLSSNYCKQNPSKDYSNNSCTSESASESIQTIDTSSSDSAYISELKSSVLGTNISTEVSDDWEVVRPTQYYERPTIDDEKDLETNLKNINSKIENTPEDNAVKVVKTSALVSALASFLTAGFLFIRIIL